MEYLIPHPRPFSEIGTHNFYEVDSKELYDNNITKYGDQWKDYWENKNPISYKINSLGYRMNEIDEIDQDNYIVTLGCSHTAGLGLPLKETWAHKLSQHLGAHLVNGSAPGSSNDLILINLIRILSNLKKPKLVIVAWTSIYRKLFWDEDKLIFHLPESFLSREGIVDKRDKGWFKKPIEWEGSYNEFLLHEKEMHHSFNELKQQVISLCKMNNVPIMMISLFKGYKNHDDILTMLFPDDSHNIYNRARDIMHYGIDAQNVIVRSILKKYKYV